MPTQRHLTPSAVTSANVEQTVERLLLAVDGINARLTELEYELKRTLYAPPDKPRESMYAKADGLSWNPGAGAGLYQYQSGAWVKL